MSDGLKELLWMTGCTTVMICVGIIALVGYLRLRSAGGADEGSAPVPGGEG